MSTLNAFDAATKLSNSQSHWVAEFTYEFAGQQRVGLATGVKNPSVVLQTHVKLIVAKVNPSTVVSGIYGI